MQSTLDLAGEVGKLLSAKGWTITTAESSTGGLLMSTLTDIPGSSAYVNAGLITYATEVAQNLIGIQLETLIQCGAVSEPIAKEMAIGVRQLFDADIGVSVTGIAGPGGGTDEKSVGLTYIGFAGRGGILEVRRFEFEGNRLCIKQSSVNAALQMILEHLG